MPRERPGRPLAGIGMRFRGFARLKVLDFSKLLPGPYATQVLADMGMAVTRVELPHFPDPARRMPPMKDGVGALYWMLDDGKKLLSLDFRKPAGLSRLKKLAAKADVLVEGFRPGLMDRLGLGYRELSRLNKRLVYASIIGYPGEQSRKAGHDINFLAASGMLGLGNSEGRVAFPPGQVGDLAGSLGAVGAILAALLERETTGRGRRVTVSMAQAAHSLLAIPLAQWAAAGRQPGLREDWWSGANPFYNLYETKDGRWLAVGALEKSFAYALLDAVGLSSLKDKSDDLPLISRELTALFRSAALAEWEERLKDKDVCATPVRTLAEASALLA